MHANRSKYLVLVIFIISILLIVFLQFNSGRSIEDLVKGNKNLLHELQVQSQLQKLETEIIYIESSIRGFVITEDSAHLQGVAEDISRVEKEVGDLNAVIGDTTSSDLLRQLSVLIKEKILHSNQVMEAFFKKGKTAAEEVINTNRGKIIRDSISNTVRLINLDRQAQLSNISTSVNSNGLKAKTWGIILALLACLASLVTFWYLINQGQRQRKLISTLDTSERQLKEASKIKEQFVANISHEIRTPMNAVLGFAGLLQKTSLNKNQHEYVKSIRSSAENLLTIINDILDLSRIESGMMHIESLPFNLRELLDSLATMMNVKAKNRGLYLRTEVEDSIPENLKGDAVRLTQILMNLISNALKFTHEGGVSIKLETADTKDKTIFIRFTISDTGIGISPEKQKTIFDRFQQAQTETTRRYGGTGLGLSIVKQLVEIQNGSIMVESEPGKGSIFTVVLPFQIAAEEEIASIMPRPVLVAEPLLQKIKLLVAEDNLMNQKLIHHLMEQWQIDFDIVSNGAAAVESLRQKASEYNMVLMDIQMPEMDGYTATEKIRYDLNLSIPIIAMTAHALAGEKEKCLSAGMDDYISKPLNEELLYKLINKYTQRTVSGNAASVINMEYLQSLSKGDKAFETNMIKAFSRQMPLELNDLKTAIEDKNYKRIARIAHNMKSTVSYMGLHQLTPLLLQIETESELENSLTRINEIFILIDATCQLAIKEAQELNSMTTNN
jgi:signal transduction histidine kinase/CheY-like chemotaxis protein/HPt (histidine-containing phosphotransfer) domain-containing protein